MSSFFIRSLRGSRHVSWTHTHLGQKLWKRPAALMGSRVEHTITLNDGVIAILKRVEPLRQSPDDLIFPGAKRQPLSDKKLSKIVRQANRPFTVHGFRSTFRDWVAERMPNIPDPVAEVALAHAVQDKVMAAYKRTHFEEMRRLILDGWSAFLEPETDPATSRTICHSPE